jgi:ribosomal protein S1
MSDGQDQQSRMDAHLEAEIEAALGDMSVEDMLDIADRSNRPGTGDRERKTGTITGVRGNDVFVEFGPKSQGICPITMFKEPPTTGQSMEFIIERYDEQEGILMLSREGSIGRTEWDSLQEGHTIEARCTGTNKGGLEMDVNGHQAFMPAGQVDLRHIDDLQVFVGEKLPCTIIELNRAQNRMILSRKSFLESERSEQRGKLLESLEEGQTHPATIVSLQNYGAFADLGGVDGLIHISDLAWERIKHPSEVVKEGEIVNVKILKIDRDHDPVRIGLGLKQTMEDPYDAGAATVVEGSIVSGKVTKLMPFGAFVELAPSVEGLIHISELSHDRVNKVSSVVKPGEVVTVKVLSIDNAQRRIALSLKQAKADREDAGEASNRSDDPHMRKLMAQLGKKFGDNLKGGIG